MVISTDQEESSKSCFWLQSKYLHCSAALVSPPHQQSHWVQDSSSTLTSVLSSATCAWCSVINYFCLQTLSPSLDKPRLRQNSPSWSYNSLSPPVSMPMFKNQRPHLPLLCPFCHPHKRERLTRFLLLSLYTKGHVSGGPGLKLALWCFVLRHQNTLWTRVNTMLNLLMAMIGDRLLHLFALGLWHVANHWQGWISDPSILHVCFWKVGCSVGCRQDDDCIGNSSLSHGFLVRNLGLV